MPFVELRIVLHQHVVPLLEIIDVFIRKTFLPKVVDIDEVVGVLPASLVRLVRMHDTRQAVRMRVPEFATPETV